MKHAPFALLVFAVLVATAWPLSSAIGSATAATAAAASDIRAAGCVPDSAAEGPRGLALPPGHPPVDTDVLPPGHPPITSGAPRLPPGHPPLPSGQPPLPSGPGPLFGAPVLLTI